jgi:DNA-binding FadR family transcriptional regulator
MPRAIARDIARTLRSRIEAGEWADDRMPPERTLAHDFGVARNTVRRAMALLKQDGSVAGHVGRGTFVLNDRSMTDVVARMQGASPADVMEIRIMLEPGAAGFAATNASRSDIATVEEAHQRAEAAVALPDFERWDAEFHHRIVACSRNDLLKDFHELLRGLRNQNPWFEMKRRSFTEDRRHRYCLEHAAVLAALQSRDPDAAREAMLAHLVTVRLNMLGR